MAWSLKTFLGLSTDASAANLNQIRTNLNDHLRLHAHTGAAGDGGAGVFVNSDYIQLPPWFPFSNSGWGTLDTSTVLQFGARLTTDNTAQGNSVTFKITPRAGTWRFDLLHSRATNYGIATITIDGVSIGTADFYNGSTVHGSESSITGITIANTPIFAPVSLVLTMSTKNASSSAYGAGINFICLRRTGA